MPCDTTQIPDKQWWIYLLRTAMGHLYCGITTDVTRRLSQHQHGRGAKSLRGKGPLQLVWTQPAHSHSDALRCEAKIKRLPKQKKEELVKNQMSVNI